MELYELEVSSNPIKGLDIIFQLKPVDIPILVAKKIALRELSIELINLGWPSLKVFDLSESKLKYIFPNSSNLRDHKGIKKLVSRKILLIKDSSYEFKKLKFILKFKSFRFKTNQTFYLDDNKIIDSMVDEMRIKKMISLKELDLSTKIIEDLQFLEDLSKLTFLNLENNKIKNLRVIGQLNEIEDLNINFNNISDISPLEGLKKLKSLKIKGNEIQDLTPLKKLKNLEKIEDYPKPLIKICNEMNMM